MFSNNKQWSLDYTTFSPEKEKHTETLCTIGNGYIGNRGAFEEVTSSESYYPATYIAGMYNRRTSKVADRDVENEDFVNCPNWTYINFKIDDGEWFNLEKTEIISYHKQLNMLDGTLNRAIKFKDKKGRITTLSATRFVSMDNPHLAAIQFSLTPENYSASITFRSGLYGNIINDGVDRYKELDQLHLAKLEESSEGELINLLVRTNQSQVTIAESAFHQILKNKTIQKIDAQTNKEERLIENEFTIDATEKEPLTIEKFVAIFTSKEWDSSDPKNEAQETLRNLKKGKNLFSDLYSAHKKQWATIWDEIDIELDGDDTTQHIIRLHSYHLTVSASPHNTKIDASVPARGLHGEAYRGHIFWDDMFIMPFFEMHYPEVARSLIMYRYRRLDKARAYAKEYGYKGAMFPWQSGSDGREETQIIHLNPISGEWGDDYSSLQRHVSLAIAYDVWMYYWKTGDIDFLTNYGAEILFEIARFWESKCEYNKENDRYSIKKVMGPNEYHEKHPGADEGGLKDNAYTNIMTAWLFSKCRETAGLLSKEALKKISSRINLSAEEQSQWLEISKKLNLVIKDGIISQYDGFLELDELDWNHYREKYTKIGRMDRILKAENRSPDDYQLCKQADLLMVFYILPLHEIKAIITDLGYQFTSDMLAKNYHYYLDRTSHGSTLSLIVHAQVAALLGDMQISLNWFEKALQADVADIQGGTTKEGIHAGLMAGTVNLLLNSYAGLDLHSDQLSLNPALPTQWKRIKFQTQFRGDTYKIEIYPSKLLVEYLSAKHSSITIKIADKSVSLENNQRVELTYERNDI